MTSKVTTAGGEPIATTYIQPMADARTSTVHPKEDGVHGKPYIASCPVSYHRATCRVWLLSDQSGPRRLGSVGPLLTQVDNEAFKKPPHIKIKIQPLRVVRWKFYGFRLRIVIPTPKHLLELQPSYSRQDLAQRSATTPLIPRSLVSLRIRRCHCPHHHDHCDRWGLIRRTMCYRWRRECRVPFSAWHRGVSYEVRGESEFVSSAGTIVCRNRASPSSRRSACLDHRSPARQC